ncbi:uncharacterized protein LOC134528979 [Bacillus rossius redtenbacheri]|uniref:uncharacterized protein LOC134528979 n=1 Tax=Bacillus rossius redtenbacheri TaxID=93214 RepID=UPI002FDEF6B2
MPGRINYTTGVIYGVVQRPIDWKNVKRSARPHSTCREQALYLSRVTVCSHSGPCPDMDTDHTFQIHSPCTMRLSKSAMYSQLKTLRGEEKRIREEEKRRGEEEKRRRGEEEKRREKMRGGERRRGEW